MEQIYAADQKILRDFVRNMADCYMDTAFGHGVDLLIKLEHSGNNTIRWRKVRKEDASFLYNLMNTPEIAGRLHENPTTVDDWAKTIERLYQDDDEEGYIILAQDVPVGWIRICGLLTVGQSVVYINSFVLTPVHQGRGIGEYVLKETVKTLKLRGYIRVSIHISQENIQAKRCCQKCGFEVTEEAERQMLDGTVVKCYMMEVLCY